MNITSYFAKDLFQGKTVFITGGSSGINLGIARNFAAVGANLGIVGRSQEKLDAAAAEMRAACSGLFHQFLTAATTSAAELKGTKAPFAPGRRTSRMPPVGVPTTHNPRAMASRNTLPNPSNSDGNRNTPCRS